MNNSELIAKINRYVGIERKISVKVLELLAEIEKRKAYCDLGYNGLFSFCVKELKYTEAQAYRRIQAMRALKELPELKQKIEEGSLSVTTVSQVQTFVRQEVVQNQTINTKEEKLNFFQSFQNQSAKQVENALQKLKGERVKVKLYVEFDDEAQKKWEKVKNLSAHKTNNDPLNILNMLMDQWLEKNDPEKKVVRLLKKESLHYEQARYIPAHIKKEVWMRDKGECVICKSKYKLQIDHIHAFAEGGETQTKNLRLLCANHNLHAGIQKFGLQKMRRV